MCQYPGCIKEPAIQKSYLVGSVVNLTTLIVGLLLGFFVGSNSVHVHAQTAQPQTAQARPTQEVEQITPGITAGSAAFGTLLAGRFAADEIGTHGIDLFKLDTNILNVLASKPFFTHDELQKAIDDARTPKLLQMKPQLETPTPGVK
jgi:hypothetical protein